MNLDDGKEQFLREVFPAELEEISQRRQRLHLPTIPLEPRPSTRQGLVGLSLSGGGIRSATLSLGVVQALARHGLLKRVDYLSTVSGGGFMGSCLSSVLNDSDTGPEQERFPLRIQVGVEEPLAVGHLRESSRYLASSGFVDKLRIPAIVLRGILSNVLIFLLLILLLVFATEMVYEIGQSRDLPLGTLLLGGLGVFVVLVVGFPLLARGRSTWTRRNLEEIAFTVALGLVLFVVFLIPLVAIVDQAIDSSWSEVKQRVTANLLRPFEARDYLQWLIVFGLLVVFMLAGRASEQVSRLGGKIILYILGLLGPAVLGMIYLGLVVLEIDSPYITPTELFSLDPTYAEDLSEAVINSDLRRRFRENQVHLSSDVEVITLREDVRWLIRDGTSAYTLVRELDDLSVYPDFQDALNRERIPPQLIASLEHKGYVVDPSLPPKLLPRPDNQFEIHGSRQYWMRHDTVTNEWSIEQVVNAAVVIAALQNASYDLQISDTPSGILLHEDIALSEDDTEHAIRFVEEGNPHDVVVLVDNSTPPFATPEAFKRIFTDALAQALKSTREDVRMAVFLFDEYVHTAAELQPLTNAHKQALVERLRGRNAHGTRLEFQSPFSNSAAALTRAMRELTEKGRAGVRKSIVFISDGVTAINATGDGAALETWIKEEFARDAATAGIRVYGIALSGNARFELFHALASKTRGAFYPVFGSKAGVTSQDVFGAMEKLKESAGGRLVTPRDQVSMTDKRDGSRYTLTRSTHGIRIRATLPGVSLAREDLSAAPKAPLPEHWRDVFAAHGLELAAEATVTPDGDSRWSISDPYRYVISRSGQKLRVTLGEEDGDSDGVFARLERIMPSSLWDDRTDWMFTGMLALLLLYWLGMDVNVTAAHRFYRDKLSKAYLFRAAGSGGIVHHDKQKLSSLNTAGSVAPYHLINVALNLQGSTDPSLRGRNSDFFFFSKRYTGSIRTGFLETERMERYHAHLDLGTAMAISGAAAAPNMGATTVMPLVFILTLLNIRLGYWLPHPRRARHASWLTRMALRRGPGPTYLLKESVGHVNARGTFVNVSDGGHMENLGLYELLRRRCAFIIAVDAGADPALRFGDLVTLMLYARIDMGVEIDLNLDPLRQDADGVSSEHTALGTVHYADGEIGHLLYIKSSVTGDEYEYVRAYRSEHPGFPHESTAQQFFDEAQFEAYRALGYHIGDQLCANDNLLGEFTRLKAADVPVDTSGK